MKYIILTVIAITFIYLLLGNVVNNHKYDTVKDTCDMQGITSRTNLTDSNLLACNYK